MIYRAEASRTRLNCCGEVNVKKRKFLVLLPKTRGICSTFDVLTVSFLFKCESGLMFKTEATHDSVECVTNSIFGAAFA